MTVPLLSDFTTRRAEVDGVVINYAIGGHGPPVLMLHGFPETHVVWHLVAPALATDHTVVLPDLRGYGDSDKPAPDPANEAYSKRAMARDQLRLMASLGFDRFDLVGHDRGARVSHRLALDAPRQVNRLAVLDIVPTLYTLSNVDGATASAYWHWFFLPLGLGVPERLIGDDPELFLRSIMIMAEQPQGSEIDPDALAEYIRCFSDPAAIAAACADYRAAPSIDLEHDTATAEAGQKLDCPTLVLWGEFGFVGRHYDVLNVWREYAPDLRGLAVPAGHLVPEEAPGETLNALREFLPA